MEQSEINRLLNKIAGGQATIEDQNKISQWLKTLDDQSLEEFMDRYEEILKVYKSKRKDNNLQTLIENRISDYERSRKLINRRKSNSLLSIVGKVAIFIFILVLGYRISVFLQVAESSPEPINALASKNNGLESLKTISPGDKRAVIISESGAEIALNSLQIGQWIDFGGARIRKSGDGTIEYDQTAKNPLQNIQHTIKTPIGGEFNVVLSDGTRVWLNSASSISFPNWFDRKSRDVSINGEVYFEVTKQVYKSEGKVPFTVYSKNQRIEVLGTQFSVSAYADAEEVATALVEGSVKVSTDKEIKLLEAGEKVAVNKEGNIRTVVGADVEKSIAWTQGYFYFDEKNVSEIFQELERWYDVEFKLDGNLPDEGFGGRVSRTKNLREVLHLLEITELVKFEVDEDLIIVRKGL